MSHPKIYVFAEDHTPQIRDWIENKIHELINNDKITVAAFLSEELGPYSYTNKSNMLRAINERQFSISDRTLQLGIFYQFSLVGIDDWDTDTAGMSIEQIHKIREAHMLSVIRQWVLRTPENETLIILLGGAHLTDQHGKETVVGQYLTPIADIYRVTDPTLRDDTCEHPISDPKNIKIEHSCPVGATEALSALSKRQRVEQFILDRIDLLDPSGNNGKRYRELFAKMNNEAFDIYMQHIRDQKRKLVFYVPNMKSNVRMEDVIQVADSMGLKLFERIRLWDSVTRRYYITPTEYLVVRLPVRRLRQYLESKMSIPESDGVIDLFSGQVIKPDKGSSISLVELQTLLSKNLVKSIIELARVRGGDINAYASVKGNLEETGSANLNDLEDNTRVRSAVVANAYMRAMHLLVNF